MAGEHILIVDDEHAIQTSLRGVLEDEGYRVTAVGNGADALRVLADETPDLVFLDIWMPGRDGLDTLGEIKRLRPEPAVIMISGHATIETAVKATRLGAYDFIEKPLSLEKVLLTATHALEHARLARENETLRARLDRRFEITGDSPVTRALREQIALAAPTMGRVLIHGENGSGKELVARAIHALSARADQALVEVNCAAIPEELIESELFGHEKGAFTGALARRRGRFELADGGTLFLDEVGDMSLNDPGQGPARPGGAVLRAHRRQGDGQGRRARHRRLQPRPGRAHRGGAIPRGPLLPAQRDPHRGAPAARAARGHPPARRALPGPVLRGERQAAEAGLGRGPRLLRRV